LVLQRVADSRPGAERERLLQAALNHLLNIVYGKNASGEESDPYWVALAGKEAGRLAEAMGNTEAAIELYKRLSREAPSLKSVWQSRITLLENTREKSAL
jgi:hypothetical protein